MAKCKAKLSPLTSRGREIIAYVFNSIAFSSHDDNCDVETLAERLGIEAWHVVADSRCMGNHFVYSSAVSTRQMTTSLPLDQASILPSVENANSPIL
jgi:hypothetical protein